VAQYRHRRITGPRWQRIVATIVARDNGIFHICGRPGATSADHVVALADCGSNFPHNLKAVHPHCNYAKNARRSSKLRDRTPHGSPWRVWAGAIDPADDGGGPSEPPNIPADADLVLHYSAA
jgi:5-methylcytosine-specific restriction endonuclease McrA